jgi:hypothetical protein
MNERRSPILDLNRLETISDAGLERDPEKWIPIFGRDYAQTTA